MSIETSRNARNTRTDDREDDSILAEGGLSLGVTLGEVADGGGLVFQFNEDRFRHTAIIGRTGSGKSNHMQQMEREDIRSGAGVAIIAAHEEDALYALSCVPEHRLGDVVLLDFSNPEYLPRMNPLDVDVRDRAAVSKAMSDVLELVTANCHYEWAGPRFEQMLRNGLGLILDPGYPFKREIAELNKLFTDPEHVKSALATCGSRHVHEQWTKVEPSARRGSDYGEVVQWFLSKVERFSSDRVLAHVFGDGRSTVDMSDVVDGGKVLVAYVPESRIGAAAASVINKWLVMQLRDAIMNRRTAAPGSWGGLDYGMFEGSAAARGDGADPFLVYVDEFARFATPDFATLLAEARKQRVGFVLGFQTLSQMRTLDMRTGQIGGVEEAILGNVGSMVCYPVGVRDAHLLCGHFDLDADDLLNIRRYRPLARLTMDNQPTRPFALRVGLRPEPDNPSAPRRVALSHVLTGVWTKVEGVEGGSFMRMVGAGCGMVGGRKAYNGRGYAYSYHDPKTGLQTLSADRQMAVRLAGDNYTLVPVFFKDGGVDHLVEERSLHRGSEPRTMPGSRAREGRSPDDPGSDVPISQDGEYALCIDEIPDVDSAQLDDALSSVLDELDSDDEQQREDRPRDGMGHAYRYWNPTTKTYELIESKWLAGLTDPSFKTVWAVYRHWRIDHAATRDEWQSEFELRIGAAITDAMTEEEVDEFERLIDRGEADGYLDKHCPNHNEIVNDVLNEMNAALVVEDLE